MAFVDLRNRSYPRLQLGSGACLKPLPVSGVTNAYVNGLNDPAVNQFLVGPRRHKQTLDTVREFVRENWNAEDSLLFGLFVDGQLRWELTPAGRATAVAGAAP